MGGSGEKASKAAPRYDPTLNFMTWRGTTECRHGLGLAGIRLIPVRLGWQIEGRDWPTSGPQPYVYA